MFFFSPFLKKNNKCLDVGSFVLFLMLKRNAEHSKHVGVASFVVVFLMLKNMLKKMGMLDQEKERVYKCVDGF